jgi:hypothetical protein
MLHILKSTALAFALFTAFAARSASAQTVDPPGGDPHGCVPVIGETRVSMPTWSPTLWTSFRLQLPSVRWSFGARTRQLQAARGPARWPQAVVRKRH